jgi:hypothetical protein
VALAFPLIMTLFPLYLAAQSGEPQVEEPQTEEPQAEDAEPEEAQAEDATDDVDPPQVFQAAGPGPLSTSIQSTVDAFRTALGDPNNANNPGPLDSGRREINWDGGGSTDTTPPVTPFDVFLNTRGAQFTTPGKGLSQAPPSGGLQGGLRDLFNNPAYAVIFAPFSEPRLFTPVGSNITEALFFVPGTAGADPAVVTGFGAVFSDVDRPRGVGATARARNRGASTLIEYFDVDDNVIFSSFVPASPGDATFSFFGIVFEEPIIAKVRIRTGNRAPGPNENNRRDIVMMDDFLYGEPQPQNDDTPAPSPEPTPAPTAATQARTAAAGPQALTVNNGTASSTAPGTVVTVTANPAPAGQKFAGWIGDISILANPGEEITTAIVPSTTPATITATYVSGSSAAP